MRIFISCQLFFPSKLGGPANAVYWLAKALVGIGHNVKVVTTHLSVDENVPEDEWIKLDGIDVIYCSNNGSIYRNVLCHSFAEIRQCDVVLLTSICYKPEMLLALRALKLKKPVIWSPRGEFSKSAINGRLDKKLFFKFIKTFIAPRVTMHVTSDAERIDTQTILGSEIRTLLIPNYMELPTKVATTENNNNYFVFLGRIAPIKALHKLIKGLSLSKKFKSSSFTLRIVGVREPQFSSYHQELLNLVRSEGLQEKISIEEPQFGVDKLRLLGTAKFLVLVSESENFGNVVIEALSQQTPVIASVGTPWDILEKSGAGYWIDNSPESIAETIDKAIELTPKEHDIMRNNAARLSKTFDIYTNIDKWNIAIKHLCERNSCTE